MELYKRGTALSIWRIRDAVNTWNDAIQLIASQKRDAQEAQLAARLSLLASKGRLRSPEMMNAEGNEIFAVKTTGGLRAYGWFDRVLGHRAFVISHLTLKKRQKLSPKDLNRATRARAAHPGIGVRLEIGD